MGGERKMAAEPDERRRGTLSRRSPVLGDERCQHLPRALCISGTASGKTPFFPSFPNGNGFISVGLFRRWRRRQINMHRPICQYAISAGN